MVQVSPPARVASGSRLSRGAFSKKQTQSHRSVSIGAELGIHGSGPFTGVLSQSCGDEGHQSREESRAEQPQTRARGRGAQRRGKKEQKRKHTHTAKRPRNHATTQPRNHATTQKHNQPTTQPTQPDNHTTTQTPTEATGKARRGGDTEDGSEAVTTPPREGQGRGGCKWVQAGRGTAPIQRRIQDLEGAGNPPRVARGGGCEWGQANPEGSARGLSSQATGVDRKITLPE